MDHHATRRRTMDVFMDIDEIQPGELRAAQVQSNLSEFVQEQLVVSKKRRKSAREVVATQDIVGNKSQERRTVNKADIPIRDTAHISSRSPSSQVQTTPQHHSIGKGASMSRRNQRPPVFSVTSENVPRPTTPEASFECKPPKASLFQSRFSMAYESDPEPSESDNIPELHSFKFPEDGSYINEVENGIPTLLMNEDHVGFEDPDDVPVRILKDFVVFNPQTCILVPLTYLWEGEGICEAFGWAVAESAEEEEDDREPLPDDGIWFRTSTILNISLDVCQESIWIQTQYGWYILEAPAPDYYPVFIPFYIKEMLLRLVLRTILGHDVTTEDEFIRSLSMPVNRDRILDRFWTKQDLEHCQYSQLELSKIIAAIPSVDWNDVKDSPLLNLLLSDSGNDTYNNISELGEAEQSHRPARQHRSPSHRPTHISAPSHKHRRTQKPKTVRTTVTPIVHFLISSFFNVNFAVVGEKPSFLSQKKLSRKRPAIQLASICVTDLKPGDFVMVNEGDCRDESLIKFAQIIFFDQRNKNFHARWFVHASETILEELAYGQELFLSVADKCRDVLVDCLVGKCEVVRISLAERASLKWPPRDTYFYSSAWDRNHPVDFIEIKDDQVDLPRSRVCQTCRARNRPSSYFKSSLESTIQYHDYHRHDFIRYRSTTPEQLTCSIGQVVKFRDSEHGIQITVRRLGRMRDRTGPGYFTETELFLTSTEEILDVDTVIGPCQVTHISNFQERLMDRDWLDQHPFSFYLESQAKSLDSQLSKLLATELKICQICSHGQAEAERIEAQCRADITLRAFDPFAGVGGFGLGLAQGCSMQTSHGVELNVNAAETMRRNFSSETNVHTADACQILRCVVSKRAGMPRRGQIDLIYTGPPCQNDSTLNIHKTDRKCLAFTALSYVDALRPPFFIMESVPGFLLWKVQGSTHEIKAGDLKLVLKVLHFLGYNIMGQIIHARSFGVPQMRNRFFIVATLPGWGDFKFPEVTHTFRPGQQFKHHERLGSNLKLVAAIAPRCAPHEVVTVKETLADLPFFDWTSPRKPTTQQQKEDAVARAKAIPAVPCDPDNEWGVEDTAFHYNFPDANAYQQRARWGCEEKAYQHFTKHFPSCSVQNVCDIPFARGADYRHLNQSQREWSLRDPASASAMGGFQAGAYRRLDGDGYFQTIVTNVGPNAKQSMVLHPFCKRILTVRELARAQGFPDDFAFYSETDKVDDYHRQIGNSVPFGVSAALGRSFQDLVLKFSRNWQRRIEQGEDSEDI